MNFRLLLAVLVSALVAAAFLLFSHGAPIQLPGLPARQGITSLAARVPRNAGFFMALDARGQVSFKAELMHARDRLKNNQPVLDAWLKTEKDFGFSADGLVEWLTPSVFVAVLPAPAQATIWGNPVSGAPVTPAPATPPDIVFGIPVSDEKAAQEQLLKWLTASQNPTPKPVEDNATAPAPREEMISDVKFFHGPGGFLTVHEGFLLGANSKIGAEALLASFSGKASNLTSNPLFIAMRRRFPREQGILAYAPLTGLSEALPALARPTQIDQRTQEALGGLQYVAASLAFEYPHLVCTCFLAADGQSQVPPLKALLTSPNQPPLLAGAFSGESGNFADLNIRYAFNLLVESLRMLPAYRARVEQGLTMLEAASGLNIEKDVWGALTGEVALSSDALIKLPGAISGSREPARFPTYLIALSIADPAKAEALLARLEALTGPFLSGSKVGEAQLYRRKDGIPVFRCLVNKPGPALWFAVGPDAESLLSRNLKATTFVAGLPEFSEAAKKQPERWVHCSYFDFGPLLSGLQPILASREDTRALADFLDNLKDNSIVTTVSIENDGVSLTSEGNGMIAAGGLGFAGAILLSNTDPGAVPKVPRKALDLKR